MPMRLTRFETATDFLDAVRPVLGEHEAEHHLVLGVAEAFASSPSPAPVPFMATVEDDAGLALASWMEGSHPLLLASDRNDVSQATDVIVALLAESGPTPVRVIGAVGQVETFASAWTRRVGKPTRVAMRQRAYRLDAVEPITSPPGHLRLATMHDLELVAAWTRAFELEALGPLASPEYQRVASRRIAAGGIYLWCDEDTVARAMAGAVRPTAHGIAVNSVYTPREWRGRGYATACVAALSRRLLGAGFRFCVLYTDLSNPTSNAIYTRIGYRPVRDFLMYELVTESQLSIVASGTAANLESSRHSGL